MTDISEKVRPQPIEIAKLAIGFGHLLRALEDFQLHFLRPAAQLFVGFELRAVPVLQSDELSDILDPVDDIGDLAILVEDRLVEGAPVPRFEAASVGLSHVVLLDGHRVTDTCFDDTSKRIPQNSGSRRGRIFRVIRKDIENIHADDNGPVRHRRIQIGIAHRDDGQVPVEDQIEAWG
ncbi:MULTISPECIES: hypothetical protein [unclassified Rhizobium]|uniref:hypothetical protein n=1 Tax=unclassified Rhizobium TaxID=2613769 RepID=UPI001FCDEA19|nr:MULTISPECIES: hypothetical protein [unclassified Rhizobium]